MSQECLEGCQTTKMLAPICMLGCGVCVLVGVDVVILLIITERMM